MLSVCSVKMSPQLQLSVLCLAALAPSAALTPGKVIVVGSHNQDLITSGARIPRPGETVLHDTFSQAFGGKGANQAVQAALLGAETHFVGKVGDDAYGKAALENLQDRGVIIDNVRTTKTAPTGVAFVAVGAEDETNSIVVVPGANFELTPDDVDAAIFDGAGVLLCQLEIPQATTLRALELAAAAGCVSVLNTAPVPPGGVDDALLRAASIVCPNEVELALLAGANEKATAATVAGAVCAAKDLQRRGAKIVLATLGGNGSLLVEGDLAIHVPAVAADVIDTTGAGDSFLGAFAAAKSAGLSTLAAIRAAGVVAARSVQGRGAQPSYATAADLDLDALPAVEAIPSGASGLFTLREDGSIAGR